MMSLSSQHWYYCRTHCINETEEVIHFQTPPFQTEQIGRNLVHVLRTTHTVLYSQKQDKKQKCESEDAEYVDRAQGTKDTHFSCLLHNTKSYCLKCRSVSGNIWALNGFVAGWTCLQCIEFWRCKSSWWCGFVLFYFSEKEGSNSWEINCLWNLSIPSLCKSVDVTTLLWSPGSFLVLSHYSFS